MKLRRLDIRRLPGIADGFSLAGLETGLNVVLGPNASGKSSLCRAVRALLYEEEVHGVVHLEAQFEDSDGLLEVVRQGKDVRWSRSGVETGKPQLPDARLISCFTVQLEDLLSEGETEKEIRERIGKILAGGYDLEAVRHLERFHTRPLHGRIEERTLRNAERALKTARDRQGALQSEEQRLDGLRDRKKQAGLAAARIAPLKTALSLLQQRQALHAIECELAEYPGGMDRLVGNESTRLADGRSTLEGHRRRLEELTKEREEAAAKLERSGLEGDEPDGSTLAERRQTLKTLRTVEKDRESADESVAVARRALGAAIEELGGDRPASETRIPPNAVRRAEEGLREKRDLDARERAIEKQLVLLDVDVDVDVAEEGLLDRIRDARAALSQWLSTPDWSEIPRRVTWPWVLSASLAALVGIAVAAWLVHWAFGFLSLVVIVAGIALLRRPTTPEDSRAKAQVDFRATGLEEPDVWTRDSVLQRWTALETDLTAIRKALDDARRRKDLERDRLSLRSDLARTEDDLRDLAHEVGFDPAKLDGGFDRWLRLVDAYDGARGEVADSEARRDRLVEKEERLHSSLSKFLARFGEAPEDVDVDAERLETRLRHLEDRRKHYDDARDTLNKTQREYKTTEGEIERTVGQLARIWETAGLASEDDAELARRLELLKSWKKRTESRRDKRAVALATENGLGEEAELLELIERNDEGELRLQLRAAEELAGERDGLSNKISEIESSVKRATAGNELETARAEVAHGEDRLRQRMEEEQYAAAAGFLLDEVEREYESIARPDVLRRAERWFANFTRDAYSLKSPGASRKSFRVRESSTGEDRDPSQLSSGTRMQLFLALRLAFAEEAEDGRERLPIFLDEALTISDPVRFRSVVECLHAFAREQGRQIFYLTSQPHDVAALTDQVDGPEPILLHEVRRLASAVPNPAALELPHVDEIPSSSGRTPEEYGVLLRVPPVALWDDSTRIHLFHLLRDEVRLLERLLSRGIETIGRLRSLLDSGRADLFLTAEEQEDLRWRAAITGAFLEACRHGRGRPVDREVLTASNISVKYARQLASLVEELNGDAAALLEAIAAKDDDRVKWFRVDHRAQLEIYLEENGYLGSGATLGMREIELRVQSAAAADVERGRTSEAKVAEVTRYLLATVPTG